MFRPFITFFLVLVCANALHAQGVIENPAAGQTQSGIGLISGWHCTASRIEIQIDQSARQFAPKGSARGDTAAVCAGRIDTGYALLLNFNNLSVGTHTVRAYADSSAVAFAQASFSVATAGVEFVSGGVASVRATGFPSTGTDTVLEWQEAKQNFAVVGFPRTPTASELLVGAYTLERVYGWDASGANFDTLGRSTVVGGLNVTATTIARSNILVNGQQVEPAFGAIAYTDDGTRMTLRAGGETLDYLTSARGDRLTYSFKSPNSPEVDTYVWRRTRATAASAPDDAKRSALGAAPVQQADLSTPGAGIGARVP